MKDVDTAQSPNKFSYQIDFRYKKLDKDLKSTDFMNSTLTLTVGDPIHEPLQRLWTTIIREINPTYSQIEIVDVRILKNES